MKEIVLHEFKCAECKSFLLLELEKDIDCCPYCAGDLDYAPGKIEPVLVYKPRS